MTFKFDTTVEEMIPSVRSFLEKLRNGYSYKYWKIKGYEFIGNFTRDELNNMKEACEVLGYENYIKIDSKAYNNGGNFLKNYVSCLVLEEYIDKVDVYRFYQLIEALRAEAMVRG